MLTGEWTKMANDFICKNEMPIFHMCICFFIPCAWRLTTVWLFFQRGCRAWQVFWIFRLCFCDLINFYVWLVLGLLKKLMNNLKNSARSLYRIQYTWRYFEMFLHLNLNHQISALGNRVFTGINIASILVAIIIEECILPELKVYFWLMILQFILTWLLLFSDIKLRTT